MKALRTVLYFLGYLFQYLMPIILFGIVVPYYRGTMNQGMTGAGLVALCLALFITYRKIERKINENCTGALHGVLLSIFPIVVWIALGAGIDRVMVFVRTLVDFWWIAFIFIVIGRILSTVADELKERYSNGQ